MWLLFDMCLLFGLWSPIAASCNGGGFSLPGCCSPWGSLTPGLGCVLMLLPQHGERCSPGLADTVGRNPSCRAGCRRGSASLLTREGDGLSIFLMDLGNRAHLSVR